MRIITATDIKKYQLSATNKKYKLHQKTAYCEMSSCQARDNHKAAVFLYYKHRPPVFLHLNSTAQYTGVNTIKLNQYISAVIKHHKCRFICQYFCLIDNKSPFIKISPLKWLKIQVFIHFSRQIVNLKDQHFRGSITIVVKNNMIYLTRQDKRYILPVN